MSERDSAKLYRVFYVLGDSTNLKILFELERFGEKTFTELRDNLKINPTSLSKKLSLLTQAELVMPDRTHDNLRVYYSIHNHAKPLKRVLDAIERLSGQL